MLQVSVILQPRTRTNCMSACLVAVCIVASCLRDINLASEHLQRDGAMSVTDGMSGLNFEGLSFFDRR